MYVCMCAHAFISAGSLPLFKIVWLLSHIIYHQNSMWPLRHYYAYMKRSLIEKGRFAVLAFLSQIDA